MSVTGEQVLRKYAPAQTSGREEDTLTAAADEREASLLLAYVMSGSGEGWQPGAVERDRYLSALRIQLPVQHRLDPRVFRFPSLLGALDILSRLLYPRSILQLKLIVALAVVECHPASARWLLPRDRGVFGWLLAVTGITVRLLGKLCLGLVLLVLCRGFVRRNVGTV